MLLVNTTLTTLALDDNPQISDALDEALFDLLSARREARAAELLVRLNMKKPRADDAFRQAVASGLSSAGVSPAVSRKGR